MEKLNILCPVDFTSASENGLKYAFEFAEQSNSELVLIHVIAPQTDLPLGFLVDDSFFQHSEEIKDKLEKNCERLGLKGHYKKVNPAFFIKVGYLQEEIKTSVKEKNIDLVVMGTKTNHGLSSKLFGTNSIDTFEHTDCPVLIVPDNFSFKKFTNIIYATDGQINNEMGIKYSLKIAGAFNATLHCVKVQEENDGEQKLSNSNLDKFVYNINEDKIFFHTINSGNAIEGINEMAERKDAELIIIESGSRNIFERFSNKSIAKVIALNPDRPLLLMHLSTTAHMNNSPSMVK